MSRKVSIVKLFIFSAIFINLLIVQTAFSFQRDVVENIGIVGKDYEPDEILVRFATKIDGSQLNSLEKEQILSSLSGASVERSLKIVPGLTVVKFPEGLTVKDSIELLKFKNEIIHVQPNFIYTTLLTEPNDPCFPYQWGLHNTGQLHPLEPFGPGGFITGTPDADIDAPEAWDIRTDTDIIVAVIDSGVDYTHPDLSANMWINENEIPDNDIDDDNNGYVDDIYGYDFCAYGGKQRDSDPIDEHFHGTHCAGIIGAAGNNNEGVTGVCRNVKIMAAQFMTAVYDPSEGWRGKGNTIDAIDAIEYAVDNGAKVLSNSWGANQDDPALYDAIEAADDAGVIFVASAGNGEGVSESYPACYPCDNIISVLATDHNDGLCSFSSYGIPTVDLGAPGEDILSTFPTYQTASMAAGGFSTNYEASYGTSASTPFVAGACALVWAVDPQLTHDEVIDIIFNTTDTCSSLRGMCNSEGRLNLHKAMLEAAKDKQIVDITADVNDCVFPYDEMFGTYIDYYIDYDANGFADTNSQLIDRLPEYLTYYSSSPEADDYNPVTNTVTWDMGTLTGNESGSVQITVTLNKYLLPCSLAENTAVLKGDNFYSIQTEEVVACNWGPDIIYVDADANNPDCNGISWENAYPTIQQALEYAGNSPDSFKAIWVAAGTYKPVYNINAGFEEKSFELVEGVDILGHFAGYETSPSQRDFTDANNTTFLQGLISDTSSRIDNIVTAHNINGCTLDGFTILYTGNQTDDSGIYLNNSSTSIANCIINNIYGNGIICENSSQVNIEKCQFLSNYNSALFVADFGSSATVSGCTFDGDYSTNYGILFADDASLEVTGCEFKNHRTNSIHGSGGGYLTVTGCNFSSDWGNAVDISNVTAQIADSVITLSGGYGISASVCDLEITGCTVCNNTNRGIDVWVYPLPGYNELVLKNNIIRHNGNSGVWIHNSKGSGTSTTSTVEIINNWIHNNTGDGITFQTTRDPGYLDLIIRNNTIYQNSGYGITGTSYEEDEPVLNCIIYDNTAGDFSRTFTDVNHCCLQSEHLDTTNITDDPDFMNISTDANDLHISYDSPCIDAGDPAGDYGDEKDIDGEDRIKYDRVDIGADEYYYSNADFDLSNKVDFIDEAILANTWLCDNADQDWNGSCDLYEDNFIDGNDLELFCEDWLWEPGWVLFDGFASTQQRAMMLPQTPQLQLISIAEPVESKAIVLSYDDIKLTLDWLDKVFEETDKTAFNADTTAFTSDKDYINFRTLLEQELLDLLKSQK